MFVPATMVFSIIFQTSILLVKKIQSRNQIYSYIKNLRTTLVEGVANVFSNAITLLIFAGACAFAIVNVKKILENNEEESEPTASILPPGIVWMMILLSGVIAAPFLTRHALRSAATSSSHTGKKGDFLVKGDAGNTILNT